MNDVVVDRLRIRGPQGRRLASVATRCLPAALDRALADLDDARLGSLTVTLDVDPQEYDDETLATLWADLVRQAALAGGARRRPATTATRTGTSPGPPGGADTAHPGGRAFGSASDADDIAALATAAVRWLADGAPPTATPVLLAALTDVTVSTALARRLGQPAAARLAEALAAAARPAATSPPGRAAEDDTTRPPGRTTSRGPSGQPSTGPPRPPVTDDDDVAPDRSVASVTAAAQRVSASLDLARSGSGEAGLVDLTRSTRAAGLVLLHPWLADLCRQACAWHPAQEEVLVRRLVLALVVDPDDRSLADDPLVLLLAGASSATEPLVTEPSVTGVIGVTDTTEVTEAVEATLSRFADLLPGFARSTPGFVRRTWIERTGLLDDDQDPAVLLAARNPLDVVLAALPYPVGLLRLPWTVPLAVRFVP